MHGNPIMHRNSEPRLPREEWPFVRRAVLTIACIHLVALLAVGGVVWQTGGKLEPRATLAAQVNGADLNFPASPAGRALRNFKSISGAARKY
jgi:hypothetical protein